MTVIIGARAIKIEMVNNIVANSGEINVETKHDFKVNYAEDGEHCRAFIQIGIQAQDRPETLKIACDMVGDFSIAKVETDEDKKKAHVECYRLLFPYAQSLLARLCTDAVLPPFYFPQMDMKEELVTVTD